MTTSAPTLVTDRGIVSERSGMATEYWRPFVWSALFGGMICALGIQIIFTLFGVGIGMAFGSASAPATNQTPYPAVELGIASIVWLLVSGMVSFGVGGWVAGRMSGYLRTGTGAMHGVAAWALAAVLGATVTALAGAPVLGGAAAGAGALASRGGQDAWSSVSNQTQGSSERAAAVGSSAPTLTEAELKAQADEARRAASVAALCTGAAFLLSMAAAGVGGTLGRKNLDELIRDRKRQSRAVLQTR